MTQLEDDLLTVLKEILDASQVMTAGNRFSADDMMRYKRAVEWSKRVIDRAEFGEKRENRGQSSLF
jgi:hypothetical protein